MWCYWEHFWHQKHFRRILPRLTLGQIIHKMGKKTLLLGKLEGEKNEPETHEPETDWNIYLIFWINLTLMHSTIAIPHLVFLMVPLLFTFTVALLVFSHHLQHESILIESGLSFWYPSSVCSVIPPTSPDRVFHGVSSHLGPLFKTLQHFPLPTWLSIANKNWSWIQRLHKISWVNAVPNCR